MCCVTRRSVVTRSWQLPGRPSTAPTPGRGWRLPPRILKTAFPRVLASVAYRWCGSTNHSPRLQLERLSSPRTERVRCRSCACCQPLWLFCRVKLPTERASANPPVSSLSPRSHEVCAIEPCWGGWAPRGAAGLRMSRRGVWCRRRPSGSPPTSTRRRRRCSRARLRCWRGGWAHSPARRSRSRQASWPQLSTRTTSPL